MATLTFSIMTYNIGGGARRHPTEMASLLAVLQEARPDVLAMQEVSLLVDREGVTRSPLDAITAALGPGATTQFAPTLTLKHDAHPGKDAMTKAQREGARDWQQGNALASRWPFIRLGMDDETGVLMYLPLFTPPRYLGNRDTEPRCALIARVGLAPIMPLAISLHLTTLKGERGSEEQPGIAEAARAMRLAQAEALISELKSSPGFAEEVILLAGDFNAMEDEPCMAALREAGFLLLAPEAPTATHPKAPRPIDHLLIRAGGRLESYHCRVIDSPESRLASDHLPVMATITLRTEKTS